jgi:hypothetical protein
MHPNDLAKLASLAIAAIGLYSAWKAYERKEDIRNGVMLIAGGVSVYTALQKL